MLKQNSSRPDNMSNAAVSRRESCVSGDKPNSICSSHQQFASLMYLTSVRRQMHFRRADVGMFARASGIEPLEFRLTIVRDFKITVDLVSGALLFFYVFPRCAFHFSVILYRSVLSRAMDVE